MVLDADLEGFVEFGADVDEVAAAQRRLRAQAGSAAGGLELSSGESEEPGAAAAPAGRRSRRTRLGPGGGGGDGPQVPDELLPKVAIIGRPNVGKSGAGAARGGHWGGAGGAVACASVNRAAHPALCWRHRLPSSPALPCSALQPHHRAAGGHCVRLPRSDARQVSWERVAPACWHSCCVGADADAEALSCNNRAPCRLYTRAFWGDREFLLIDTGGLMSDAEKLPKEQQVRYVLPDVQQTCVEVQETRLVRLETHRGATTPKSQPVGGHKAGVACFQRLVGDEAGPFMAHLYGKVWHAFAASVCVWVFCTCLLGSGGQCGKASCGSAAQRRAGCCSGCLGTSPAKRPPPRAPPTAAGNRAAQHQRRGAARRD